MKTSSIVCASFVALAALAVTATAATTLASSKSNTSFRIDPKHTEQDCIALKGTVSTDPKEGKICTLPPGVPVPAEATTINQSKSNADSRN